ncbi:MAG: glycosyltransferase family 2 protein [Planctomycetota bacterium]|jgi:GT2 family glycosyltransferase
MSRIRVIIVSYYSRNDLERCLPTIDDNPDIEVYIVDNSSCPETRDFLKKEYPEFVYIDAEKNKGFAAANNLGAADFNGDYLCFLNPDTELLDGAITKLADFLDTKPAAVAVGPLVLNSDRTRQMSYRRWPGFKTALFHRYSLLTRLFPNNPWSRAYLMSDDDGGAEQKVDWLSACCLMVKNNAFIEIKGFDERYFMFCEDTALCKSLDIAGFERWFYPNSVIIHHIGKSVSEKSIKLVFQRHRSMWLYFKTFNKNWLFLSPLTILGLAVRFMIYSFKALYSSRNEND